MSDKWVGRAIIAMIIFSFGGLAARDILSPRKAEDCSKLCAPSSVLECGRTILCAPMPPSSVINPCPGGDCKDGGR